MRAMPYNTLITCMDYIFWLRRTLNLQAKYSYLYQRNLQHPNMIFFAIKVYHHLLSSLTAKKIPVVMLNI